MNKIILVLCVLLGTSVSNSFAFLVDSGQPPIPSVSYGLSYHSNNLSEVYWGAEFTFPQAASISGIETYMINRYGGIATVAIYKDGGDVPDIDNQIFKSDFSTSSLPMMVYGWYGLSGLDWSLPAGTYWVAFEATHKDGFYSNLPWDAPNPLDKYAYYNMGWGPGENVGIGLRISGSVSQVPIPPGILLFGTSIPAIFGIRTKSRKATARNEPHR